MAKEDVSGFLCAAYRTWLTERLQGV